MRSITIAIPTSKAEVTTSLRDAATKSRSLFARGVAWVAVEATKLSLKLEPEVEQTFEVHSDCPCRSDVAEARTCRAGGPCACRQDAVTE